MISIGTNDGRKWKGLGFGAVEEMEDTELEEGEAYTYQRDDDSAMDPDVSLSYIDEKLRDVLGHFQKDFEGGVSAENLGSKFGGYGSFLPADLRSPVWSRPRTPPKVCDDNQNRSMNNFQQEGDYINSVNQPKASLTTRQRLPSTAAVLNNDPPKRDVGVPSARCIEESTSKSKHENNYSQPLDQKTLKVRIKVGSDDLSTQRNADIHRGLGLDISPSTSFDESPPNSEGFSHEHLDASELSPTSILQIMVSFPIEGNQLLSPLQDDLINLIEKEKLQGDSSRSGRGQKSGLQNPNRTDAAGDAQASGGRKPKLSKTTVTPRHVNGHSVEDNAQNDTCVSVKQDMDINRLVSEVHVANDANPRKEDSRRTNTSRIAVDTKEKSFSKEFGVVEKPRAKASSAGKVWEDQKMDLYRDHAIYQGHDGKFKEENADALAKSESNVSTGRKSRLPDSKDPLKPKISKKAISHEEDKKLMGSRKERSSSKGQKKMKKGDSYGAQNSDGRKDSSRMDFKSQKDHLKARDAYKDLFGDIELEQGDNDRDSPEIMLTDRPIESGVIEKNTHASAVTGNGKKTSKPSIPEAYPKAAAVTGNGQPTEVPPGTAPPLVEEDWVGCDRCQQWRLLPVGTNVADLPDKWVCSMLNWLPGMNSCDISEEETTKAVVSLYHLPVSENRHNPRTHHSDHADVGNHVLPDPVPNSHQKKVNKELSEKKQDGPAPYANSTKKFKGSARTSSSSGAHPSISENDNEPQPASKSVQKQKQKNKLLEHSFDGGEPRSTTSKNRRDSTDQDYSRISKKAKVDETHLTDEDSRGKVRPSSSSGLSGNASGLDRQKYKGNHIKDIKSEKNSSLQGGPRNRRDNLLFSSDDDPSHKERSLAKDASRKRKMSETQNFQKETSENDHRKEKKPRVSKSQGRESSISKSSGGTSKQSRRTRDQQLGPKRTTPSRRSIDTMDSLKREPAHLSQAAASSSSKVSDTYRKNSNLKEIKGSPVESVSSSPMRFSHPEKSSSMRRVQNSKDNSRTPQRRSDCEDDIFAAQRGSLESSVIDAKESDIDHVAGSEPDFAYTNGGIEDVSRPRKSAKGSSTRSKENTGSFIPEVEKCTGKVPDHLPSGEGKLKAGNDKALDKFGSGVNKSENDLGGVKEAVVGKGSGENSRRASQSRFGGNENVGDKAEDIKQNIQVDRDERSSKRQLSEKAERTEIPGRGKMHPLPPSGRGQNETARHSNHVASGSQKANGVKSSSVGTSKGDDTLVAPKVVKKIENQNGNQLTGSKHSTTNGHRARDVDAPSPARRDPSAQAAVKEAKDLKHLADRLKSTGSNADSTSLYFQAVLKFLHGASLLESSNNEGSKQSEMIQSMQMYSSTAKLCEFCAHEYERSKDMAAAALAYKCMEVAYMRVVYSSHSSAGRDRHELQTALQIVPPGESPSSSASDVDNLNNLTTLDKVPVAKSVGSPQVAGSHVIAARNRPNFVRLLNFAQDVNSAMEASRKSRIAFAAANPTRVEDGGQRKESMTSVKRALDFTFQDVDGLLRLVRQAMEAISR